MSLRKGKFFPYGIHVKDMKELCADTPIEKMPAPKKVYISMSQHIGAPAIPVVNVGDKVTKRQLIGKESGVISAREGISANAVYRRKMVLRGLKDATVYLFPEKGCEQNCAVSDGSIGLDRTPVFLNGFELVRDEKHGTYLKGEHITGDIFFLMEKKKHS